MKQLRTNMKKTLPKILTDIVEFLKTAQIQISEKVEGEGRGGSLKDEGTIKRLLQSHTKFKDYVFDVPPRRFGDMLVKDYKSDMLYVVNIKTSIGSSDNATSKMGILYAFTDLTYDELPGSMNWKKFDKLLKERAADIPDKDYYFLCVDKNDTKNIIIRGCKQINCYGENANPSNLLQINWSKEKDLPPKERTYDEAYDTIVMGIARCYVKAFNNLPNSWKNLIIPNK